MTTYTTPLAQAQANLYATADELSRALQRWPQEGFPSDMLRRMNAALWAVKSEMDAVYERQHKAGTAPLGAPQDTAQTRRDSVPAPTNCHERLRLLLVDVLQLFQGQATAGDWSAWDESVRERVRAELASLDSTPAPSDAARTGFDFLEHLARQRAWSERTFGPGYHHSRVVAHIRKELDEIEADPKDLEEWIDVVLLALDGAWRAGASPLTIVYTLTAKQAKNERRAWPDWRTLPNDKPIEHVKPAPTPPPMETAAVEELERRVAHLRLALEACRCECGVSAQPPHALKCERCRALERDAALTRPRSTTTARDAAKDGG